MMMATPLGDVTFSFGYDPYEPAAELLADIAIAQGFRQVVAAAGRTLNDGSDRDMYYSLEVGPEASALALLGALLDADLDLQVEAVRGDAAAVARVNAIYVAHGRPANFTIDRGPDQAERAARAADQANLELLTRTLKQLEKTGLVRAWTSQGLGWVDRAAVHPDYGQNPRITLDKDGRDVWGAEVDWCPMLRVETVTGEQGWLCLNGSRRGPLVLDSGVTIEYLEFYKTAIVLRPIEYARPASPGAPTKRSITIPITVEMKVSAAQSEAQAQIALRAVLKEVLRSGLGVGSASAATILLDGHRVTRAG